MSVPLSAFLHLVTNELQVGHPLLFIGERGCKEVEGSTRPTKGEGEKFYTEHILDVWTVRPNQFRRRDGGMDVQFSLIDVQIAYLVERVELWNGK